MELNHVDELPPVSRWRSRANSEEHQQILDALESGDAFSIPVEDKKDHDRKQQMIRGVARRNNLEVKIVFNPENNTTNFQLKDTDAEYLTDEDTEDEDI